LYPAECSQTGLAVEALQAALPNARVMYSSATGASEPNNLRYMSRLGTSGYETMSDMVNALSK
jgi:P-loop containing NTP hydrolase pore-1